LFICFSSISQLIKTHSGFIIQVLDSSSLKIFCLFQSNLCWWHLHFEETLFLILQQEIRPFFSTSRWTQTLHQATDPDRLTLKLYLINYHFLIRLWVITERIKINASRIKANIHCIIPFLPLCRAFKIVLLISKSWEHKNLISWIIAGKSSSNGRSLFYLLIFASYQRVKACFFIIIFSWMFYTSLFFYF
jgi:hypothetical protein